MRIIPTVLLASAAIISSVPAMNHTNKTNAVNPAQGKKYVSVTQIGKNQTIHLNKELKKLGISIHFPDATIQKIINRNCSIPGINKPGTSKPETNKPDGNKPEQDRPDNNKPETDKPDGNKPEQDNTASSYAAKVAELVNKERAKAGLLALKLDSNVTKAANVRAKEIVSSFSHTRPNGSNFSTVLKENGVSYSGSGENIAWGQKTPADVMAAWMNSDGHRANILNKNYTSIGVGYYKDASGRAYWTQLFIY